MAGTSSVGVADGGNHTIVCVGTAVFVGRGVAVGGVEFKGRQATRNVIARSDSDEAIPLYADARFVCNPLRSL